MFQEPDPSKSATLFEEGEGHIPSFLEPESAPPIIRDQGWESSCSLPDSLSSQPHLQGLGVLASGALSRPLPVSMPSGSQSLYTCIHLFGEPFPSSL